LRQEFAKGLYGHVPIVHTSPAPVDRRLTADGLGNQQIVRRLSLAVTTVKDHVHRILTKTGLPNRAAVAAVYRSGRSRGSGAAPPRTSS
jgi:hypothetical protein